MSKLPAELAKVLQEKGVAIDTTEGKLPPELNDMLKDMLEVDGSLLMGEKEAKKHRESLMNERSAFHLEADDEWHHHSYSFCEH